MKGAPVENREPFKDTTFKRPDGSQIVLRYPEEVEPLTRFGVMLMGTATGEYAVVVDGLRFGFPAGETAWPSLSGAEGERTLYLVKGDEEIGSVTIRLRARTFFDAGPFTSFFDQLCDMVRKDRQVSYRKGKPVRTNPCWFRDHVHEMKGLKYWEEDLTSFVDALIELQLDDGSFYEILSTPKDKYLPKKKIIRIEPEDELLWVRLEVEADIEYLMVEAVYTIWQATGDLEGMKRRLPAMERAVRHYFNDPRRWDKEHGAVKRAFTIDTWDFVFGPTGEWWNTALVPGMPMGIMHGDNSGLYQACRQLGAMCRAAGDTEKAESWEKEAAVFRERVNRLLFNGRHYIHQLLLQPVDAGANEEEILSLSNPYDINRGLPTHEMAVKIIEEYQRRRKLRDKTHFAEWFSIDPTYPDFGTHKPGKYVNGGIAPFVAGELAKASFHHGFEDYGADILHRLARLAEEDGYLLFLYEPDGTKRTGMGPPGWSGAAVISALMEGLAGIEDASTGYGDIVVSPRFAAAGIADARVCARYGPSGGYVSLAYHHIADERTIRLTLAGAAERVRVRVLLPAGAKRGRVLAPQGVTGEVETAERSRYVVFDLPVALGKEPAKIAIEYGI